MKNKEKEKYEKKTYGELKEKNILNTNSTFSEKESKFQNMKRSEEISFF